MRLLHSTKGAGAGWRQGLSTSRNLRRAVLTVSFTHQMSWDATLQRCMRLEWWVTLIMHVISERRIADWRLLAESLSNLYWDDISLPDGLRPSPVATTFLLCWCVLCIKKEMLAWERRSAREATLCDMRLGEGNEWAAWQGTLLNLCLAATYNLASLQRAELMCQSRWSGKWLKEEKSMRAAISVQCWYTVGRN